MSCNGCDNKEEFKLPVGLTEFNEFADRIISKAGEFADRDSLVYAIAMELIHADPKTAFSDDFFVLRLRKVAANQIASQVIQDIKAKQAEALKKAQDEAALQQLADTTSKEGVSNGQEN